MDPNEITQKIDGFIRWWTVDLGMPSFIRSKDGMRNGRIKYHLLARLGLLLELSNDDDGDDGWLIRSTILEAAEIKTCLIPGPDKKKRIPGFGFHEDSVQLLRRLVSSSLIFGVFEDDEFGVEQLREVWYAPVGSELHRKHFESRLKDRSREGLEMSVTLTDVRLYARRLI